MKNRYRIVSLQCSFCGKMICGEYATVTAYGWVIKGKVIECPECKRKGEKEKNGR